MSAKSSIGALEQAIKILEIVVFEGGHGITIKEISQKIDLHPSTIYRYLNTFLNYGYVSRAPNGGYKPGIKLVELGNYVLNGFDLREIAHPYLVKLVNEVNQTAHLAIREGNEALYIDKVEGPKTLQMRSRVGMRIPLYCTALGKVLLAYSSEEDIDRYLEEVELIPRTPNTIVSPGKLKEELLSIRERGYALDNQENEEGIICVGAPITDFSGQVAAALSVSGFFKDFSSDKIPEILSSLQKTAASISQDLGAPGKEGD
ncbi:MAG TPA: IclR family transcriptional regulator [Candidatus Atribacteria bacterium]|nr:IclR family transcriptional regulator [Candidatus Atribacteria bacterium]